MRGRIWFNYGRTTHGMSKTPEYAAWRDMRNRCYRKKDKRYDTYGGRGITVCELWRTSFDAFLADVGERPSPNHSLGRVDNDGNYEPSNVKWVTLDDQANNTTMTRRVTINGVTLSLTSWARRIGITRQSLSERLEKQLSDDELLAPRSP